MRLCGIDYGSKLAGTTVIVFLEENTGEIFLYQSEKKQDADKFLKEKINDFSPQLVFIDVPLSLPQVYTIPSSEKQGDFFFRQADKLLNAMSPMFLGGLTARAMQLKSELYQIPFYETYPAYQAKRLGLNVQGYKKDKQVSPQWLACLAEQFPLRLNLPQPANWHQADALLALLAACRFSKKEHLVFGEAREGEIII